ncbi:MAG: rhomboid family intramembrane serine protease [Synechococcales bacterium]|nr:rhomboid family intramembrane serine protease [Synechococcales bacterium]
MSAGNGFLAAPFADWFSQARLLLDLIAIAWIVSIINFGFLGGALRYWGMRPRRLTGLLRIPLSPFLHDDWQHLANNSLYFLIFGGMIVLRDPADLPIVAIVTNLLTGSIIWIFGAPARYIGASDIVFGCFGFLVAIAVLIKDPISAILLTFFAFTFFFGGSGKFIQHNTDGNLLESSWGTLWNNIWFAGNQVWGMLPNPAKPNVSWEGHTIGFLSGILIAYYREDFKDWLEQAGRLIQAIKPYF